MKSNQNPTTPINQGTTHKPNIDGVCLSLCKIRGIAELFSIMLPGEMRELGCDASAGIYEILNNAADEIQTMINNTIADLTAENGPVYCFEDLKKARQKLKEREDKLKKERKDEKSVKIKNRTDLLCSLARQSCMQTDHYLFMSSMRDIADIEKDLVMGKCNALTERILELESQLSTQPTKKAAPVYLTDNVIQFPGERRGTHAN